MAARQAVAIERNLMSKDETDDQKKKGEQYKIKVVCLN
jgi:hypothetical protein